MAPMQTPSGPSAASKHKFLGERSGVNDVFWCVETINFAFRPSNHNTSTSIKLPRAVTMDDPEDDDIGLPISHGNSLGSAFTGTPSKVPPQKSRQDVAALELLKQRKALPIWSGGPHLCFYVD